MSELTGWIAVDLDGTLEVLMAAFQNSVELLKSRIAVIPEDGAK